MKGMRTAEANKKGEIKKNCQRHYVIEEDNHGGQTGLDKFST